MKTHLTDSPAAVARFEPADDPAVSIVIVTYGTGSIIVDTLASLARSISDLAVEVIVVDNPHPRSADTSATELSLFTAGVRVVSPEDNLGFGGGCELGALHARGHVLAFVNPDVTFEPGWLEPLVAALDDPLVAIAAPILLNPDGSVQEAGQRLYADATTTPVLIAPREPTVVDYASAACWVMTRETHERLGGFDPRYHPAYFEDVDLALRARSAGRHCVVIPHVRVVHHRGSGTPDHVAPASAQRVTLIEMWPEIRWTQPDSR